MAKLVNYLNKKAELERLQSELEVLENSPELKEELEFKSKLIELQTNYGKTAKDTLDVLVQMDPSVSATSTKGGAGKPRPLMTYKNPHTGEVVKTRGGNHKTLKEWREKYGKETVDSWKS